MQIVQILGVAYSGAALGALLSILCLTIQIDRASSVLKKKILEKQRENTSLVFVICILVSVVCALVLGR